MNDRMSGFRPNREGFSARILAVLIVLLGINNGVAAQTQLASIYGNVQSMDGSPLPGTSVVARHVSSDRSQTTLTDAQGQFRFFDLAPGLYELHISLAGFKSRVESGIAPGPGQSFARDFVLERTAP